MNLGTNDFETQDGNDRGIPKMTEPDGSRHPPFANGKLKNTTRLTDVFPLLSER